MVERGGLENRCPFTGTQGSNPCLSATNNLIIDVKFGKSVAKAATLPVIPYALENGVKQHAPRPTRWHVRADQVWML